MFPNEALIQNLKDAGCTPEFIKQFTLGRYGSEERLQLLQRHRAKLLSDVHAKEKQIDCLDYLVYQIQKSKTQPK